MAPEHRHIAVVNDSPEFLELMAELLQSENYAATVIDGDRDNAVDLVRAAEPDGLIIDLRQGDGQLHGLDVIREVRRDPDLSELPTLICSGDTRALTDLAEELASMRRVSVIGKPFNIDELFAKLETLLEREPA
jgi:DNA-binding response OmpR family regulator